jgi:hypothetical protein
MASIKANPTGLRGVVGAGREMMLVLTPIAFMNNNFFGQSRACFKISMVYLSLFHVLAPNPIAWVCLGFT